MVASPVVDTRAAPRFRVDKRAIAEHRGAKFACVVRDFSTVGAAVEFTDPVRIIPIEKAFVLIMPDDGLRLPCHIVWKKDYRMGVAFD